LQFRGLESVTQYASQFWIPAVALAAAVVVRIVIHRYFAGWAKNTSDELDDRLIGAFESAATPMVLVAALFAISFGLPLPENVILWIQRGVGILALAFILPAVSRVVSILLDVVSSRGRAMEGYLQPLRTLSNVMFILIGIALSLRILGVTFSNEGVKFVRIAGIAMGCYVAVKIVHLAIAKMESLVDDNDPLNVSEAEKRARTLGRIINSAAMVVVVGVGVMMILSEFGMNIMPIITGAGIVGLAVGFGAQNLVRDIISGFFLIFENQVRVGDVAVINGTGGLVEAINLRTMVLRDLQGVVHVFPNGEITQVSNMTKEWSRYVIDVGVAYKENVDHVMNVLEDIGQGLQADQKFKSFILEPLEILGVDDFGDSQVTIKVMIKTLPLKQWLVGRELRRRIKNTFDRKGIEIPFPHMSVYFGEASKPFELLMNTKEERQSQTAT
jgi:moderate conductance mechanosensitive channel